MAGSPSFLLTRLPVETCLPSDAYFSTLVALSTISNHPPLQTVTRTNYPGFHPLSLASSFILCPNRSSHGPRDQRPRRTSTPSRGLTEPGVPGPGKQPPGMSGYIPKHPVTDTENHQYTSRQRHQPLAGSVSEAIPPITAAHCPAETGAQQTDRAPKPGAEIQKIQTISKEPKLQPQHQSTPKTTQNPQRLHAT
ncbi:hypothetical protein CRENBAI_002148 [Crenichthys baileyi]|uniref:Uncharacterized protein n=1 Tax=Crenichthys baileyi TaxID=28760 RepID=A0AAV9RKX9_9TELE